MIIAHETVPCRGCEKLPLRIELAGGALQTSEVFSDELCRQSTQKDFGLVKVDNVRAKISSFSPKQNVLQVQVRVVNALSVVRCNALHDNPQRTLEAHSFSKAAF